MPFRPGFALGRLELAELLLEHYLDEKKDSLEQLDFAIGEFREMKTQPSLERALRHKAKVTESQLWPSRECFSTPVLGYCRALLLPTLV